MHSNLFKMQHLLQHRSRPASALGAMQMVPAQEELQKEAEQAAMKKSLCTVQQQRLNHPISPLAEDQKIWAPVTNLTLV